MSDFTMPLILFCIGWIWGSTIFILFILSKENKKLDELLKQKHGEWKTIWAKEDPDISTEGRCSVCGKISDRPLGSYCKWCGSKMDKE